MGHQLLPDYRGNYRPYCDSCGDKLWHFPLLLDQARNVAREHATAQGHLVRIEPWDSFQLIENVYPPEPVCGRDPAATELDDITAEQLADPVFLFALALELQGLTPEEEL